MPAPTPSVEVKTSGSYTSLELSRRQFLSYLFSYLVILSFILCLVLLFLGFSAGSVGVAKAALISLKYGQELWLGTQSLILFGITLLAWSIVFTTAQGMFFLAEKIHQP
jgi:hypothetical protein